MVAGDNGPANGPEQPDRVAMAAAGALSRKNVARAMLRSEGLLERAAVALQRSLAARPDDVAALLRLGDLYRGLGRLREALDCYARVVATHPTDPKASRLAAILSGQAPGEPAAASPAVLAAPFVHMADFLPEQRCQALLHTALASRERFDPASVFARFDGFDGEDAGGAAAMGRKMRWARRVDPHGREGLVASSRIIEREARLWLERRLRGAFAQALPRLQMREPSEYRVEMAMSAYLGGGFFAKHRDDGAIPTRRVSFAYYFHPRPQRFSGGELLLHDDDAPTFTRIAPQRNSIVLYPASCFHEVAAVHGDSADFAAARFAIHGWLHSEVRIA